MNTDILKFYSDHGWQMFPVKYGDKAPLVRWADEATTEWNKITGWLEHFGQMNIGIATGERSGIFVLDVDAGHNGFESLETLRKVYGDLPKTPTVNTGGGGKHYVFKHPHAQIRNVQNSGKLGMGLDVRGDGGYIVAAPSLHKSGKLYQWDKDFAPSTTPLADAPDWMIKLLIAEPEVISQKQNFTSDNSAVVSGNRNNYLTGLAGTMRRKGVAQEAIYNALMIENRAKCQPPLPESEVKRIAESVTRYEPNATFDDNKDRLQVEWAFCKSLFEYPMHLPDFISTQKEFFADKRLGEFMDAISHGTDVTQAAVNLGIMAELEAYKDYDSSRLDGYADAIKQFATFAKYERYAKQLLQHSKTGDVASIDKTVQELNKIPAQVVRKTVSVADVFDGLEEKINERAKNPVDVWGIPYAWEGISKLTGGKQRKELILLAAEPKIGKSWWCLQDAMSTAVKYEIPVFYWSGEMPAQQLVSRLIQLHGATGRHMKNGRMTEADWEALNEAKALILNSPLYIDDNKRLAIHEVRAIVAKQVAEHGCQQFIFDYASKIQAPGKDEIEQSGYISNEMKIIADEFNVSIVLISSVNKGGMDNKQMGKANVRGSGQQIHDADVIFFMTKFDKENALQYGVMPDKYDSTISLHIDAGRELDHQIEGGAIHYQREFNKPNFVELKGK